MEKLKDSYYKYLYDLGLCGHSQWFNESDREIYELIKDLELTELTKLSLISKFNKRVIENAPKKNSIEGRFGSGVKVDIKDHFVVTDILFNKKSRHFNNFTLYRTDYKEFRKNLYETGKIKLMSSSAGDVLHPLPMIFIGKTPEEKGRFFIPEYTTEITNTDNLSKKKKSEFISLIEKEPQFGVPREIREQFDKMNYQIRKEAEKNREIAIKSLILTENMWIG